MVSNRVLLVYSVIRNKRCHKEQTYCTRQSRTILTNTWIRVVFHAHSARRFDRSLQVGGKARGTNRPAHVTSFEIRAGFKYFQVVLPSPIPISIRLARFVVPHGLRDSEVEQAHPDSRRKQHCEVSDVVVLWFIVRFAELEFRVLGEEHHDYEHSPGVLRPDVEPGPTLRHPQHPARQLGFCRLGFDDAPYHDCPDDCRRYGGHNWVEIVPDRANLPLETATLLQPFLLHDSIRSNVRDSPCLRVLFNLHTKACKYSCALSIKGRVTDRQGNWRCTTAENNPFFLWVPLVRMASSVIAPN